MVQIILLAAGLSERFGEQNKLLYKVNGHPILSHTLNNLAEAKLGKIMIVTGQNRDLILSGIPEGVEFIETYNPNFRQGMTSSIQVGVKNCSEEITGYMICLADQILIQGKTYKDLADSFQMQHALGNKNLILSPTYQGTKGNPVILSSIYKKEILDLAMVANLLFKIILQK